jgi:ribosomal protein S18 acetylase RimI-like enzyme
MIALHPASRFTHARLAEIFTAGYEGYFTPIVVDEAAFRFMASSWDLDLDASRVAVLDDEPVAVCTLAIRGDQGWIGGLGVAAPHRSRGIGAVLMRRVIEEARSRGVHELWLEVLVQNDPAIRLYEALGFEHVRELEVWSTEELVLNQHKLPSLPVADALGREERPPWQRANESLAGLDGLAAIGDDRGTLVYRVTGSVASLLQCAADDLDGARALLAGLPPETTGTRWLNGPAGHPLNEALASIGGAPVQRQHEMRLTL